MKIKRKSELIVTHDLPRHETLKLAERLGHHHPCWMHPNHLLDTSIREGYEPVRAEDFPEFEAPTIDSGSNSGVIGVGGLILAKVPVETAEERTAYFANQAKSAMDGVDHNFMRESDGRMPIKDSDIQRTSKVAFGSKPTNKGN